MGTALNNKLVSSNNLFRDLYRLYRKWNKRRKFFHLTNEEIFSKIYTDDLWRFDGEKKTDRYYSGPGSYGKAAKEYVDFLNDFISANNISSITDAGCGDFAIGRQLTTQNRGIVYNGCDLVKPLVEYNIMNFSSEKIKFYHLDVSKDFLPKADLLTIRQVLQHLSNSNIKRVLRRIKNYKYTIITEHLFDDKYVKKFNKDKPTGPDIRLSDYSGIYIYKDPFNLPCREVLSVKADAFGKEAYIKSFLVENFDVQTQK